MKALEARKRHQASTPIAKNLGGDMSREHANYSSKRKKMDEDLRLLKEKLLTHAQKQKEASEEEERRHLMEKAKIEGGFEALKTAASEEISELEAKIVKEEEEYKRKDAELGIAIVENGGKAVAAAMDTRVDQAETGTGEETIMAHLTADPQVIALQLPSEVGAVLTKSFAKLMEESEKRMKWLIKRALKKRGVESESDDDDTHGAKETPATGKATST